MNWYRENRFPGIFLALFGVGTLGVIWFLFVAKSDWEETAGRLAATAAELNRLERLSPYPNGENLRQMKAQAENYSGALARLKEELKMRVPPVTPVAPSEFQSRLRVVMAAIGDKARANKVKLPEKFFLGFDEFRSALPHERAAPLLAQELVQIEWLLNSLLDARVEAVTAFRRTPLPEEGGAVPSSTRVTEAKSLERHVVETTFLSTPAAARKVINQIAGADRQFFCIIRLLHVRNEKEKGPPREGAEETGAVDRAAQPESRTALNFIVGNERIQTSARIEIVRFTF
jgi:hypothetical protein